MKIKTLTVFLCLLFGLFLTSPVYGAEYGSLKSTVILPGYVNELGGISGHFIPGQLKQNDILMFRLPMGSFWTTANLDTDESTAIDSLQTSPEWSTNTLLDGYGMRYGTNYNHILIPAMYGGNSNGLYNSDSPKLEVSSLIKGEVIIKIISPLDDTQDCYLYLYSQRVYIADNVTGDVCLDIDSPSNLALKATIPGGSVPASIEAQEYTQPQKQSDQANKTQISNPDTTSTENKTDPKNIKLRVGQNQIEINGAQKEITVAPYVKNNRVYVPIRVLAEALEINEIIWEPELSLITLKLNDKTIQINKRNGDIIFNGQTKYAMDAPFETVEPGYTMLPARYIVQALGLSISWDPIDNVVLITE